MIASPYGSPADRLRHAVGWTATPAAAAPVCATCDYRAQVSDAGHACLSVQDTAFATTLDAGCDRWRPRGAGPNQKQQDQERDT